MPYFIARIPSTFYKSTAQILPTSYAEDNAEGAYNAARQKERARENISTRINDTAFVAAIYRVIHAESQAEAERAALAYPRPAQPTISLEE